METLSVILVLLSIVLLPIGIIAWIVQAIRKRPTKKIRLACLIILCVFVISVIIGVSSGHQHTWNDATCLSPKTCSECGETEGEAAGHTWNDATCTTPKTCSVCNEVEGEAKGHTWANATCALPKTCTNCDVTEGEALGHTWNDATCTESKTCSTCNATEGEALGHDASGLTCTNDATCSRCNTTITAPGHTLSDATCTEPAKCSTCGETSGDALGHTSASGVCDRCGLETYETVSGRGDDVLSGITVGDGIYRIHFTHSGRSNFAIKSYDATNDKELLVNEIGNYDGYVLLLGTAPYSLEITADGNWTYTIERLGEISDTSFAGKGDYVTGLCSLSSGAWEFTHDGKSNFAVRIYTTDGRDLLVNEIGSYTGKKMVSIPAGSFAFFEITADGNWTIKKAE